MKRLISIVAIIFFLFAVVFGLIYYNKQNNLTQEQRVEDVEYMWETLNKNYPFMGVAQRNGIDFEARYKKCLEDVKKVKSDVKFYSALMEFFQYGQVIGHLEFVDTDLYDTIINTMNSIDKKNLEEYDYVYSIYGDVYDENVVKTYNRLKAISAIENSRTTYNYSEENVITEIIDKDKIAYININSFLNYYVQEDSEKIDTFLKGVSNYKNLIIDISNNTGGSTLYWQDLLVAPNISRPFVNDNYHLFTGGEHSKKRIEKILNFESDVSTIDELPEFRNINKDDLKNLNYFYIMQDIVNPRYEKRVFKGKIWLITSKNNYSASESFANFCKNTGFATIVGQKTSGDGIGIDPVILKLPNSGVLIRYSSIYGLNSDGSANEEMGTKPDYMVYQGKEIEKIIELTK